jgi:hypothetical protein
MNDDDKALVFIAIAAFVLGMGFAVFTAPTRVERIHSPPGLIVVTPEGRKVFIPDSAILPEAPGK